MKFGSEHKQFVLYKQAERHYTTPNGITTTPLGLPEILFEADTMPEIQSKMQDVLPQENQLQKSSSDPARFMHYNPRPQVAQVVLSDVAQCVFIGTNSYSIILARNTSDHAPVTDEPQVIELHFKTGEEWQIFESLDKAGVAYRGLGSYQDDSFTYVAKSDLSKVYEAIAPLGYTPKE